MRDDNLSYYTHVMEDEVGEGAEEEEKDAGSVSATSATSTTSYIITSERFRGLVTFKSKYQSCSFLVCVCVL